MKMVRKYTTNTELKTILERIEKKINKILIDLTYGALMAGMAFAFAVSYASASDYRIEDDFLDLIIASIAFIIFALLLFAMVWYHIKVKKSKRNN